MKLKTVRQILISVICISFICSMFAACSKKEKEDSGAAGETSAHTATWAVSPSIEAQAVEPFVRADFNETTGHYDISYDEWFRIKQNGKYGIIDLSGKIVVKPEYDELFAIRNSQNFIGVKIDSDGDRHQTYIHSISFKKEEAYKKYNSEKYEYYWSTGFSKPLCVKISGNKTEKTDFASDVPEMLTGVKKSTDGGYRTDGTYGLYSMNKNITGMVYSGGGQFSDGKAAFKSGDKWGYIDSNGRTVIPFEFDAIPGYSALGGEDTPYESCSGFITLLKDGKYGIEKADGTVVAPFSYDGATPVVNGRAFVCSDGKWGVLTVGDDSTPADEAPTAETASAAEEKPDKDEEEKTREKTTEESDGNEEENEDITHASEYKSGSYRVNGDLNVRSSTDTGGDNVVETVPEGESVYVDRVDGQWGHIEYNGQEGWIYLGLAEED